MITKLKAISAVFISLGFLFVSAESLGCCSLAPALFANTRGWVGETHRNGKVIHVLAYENAVQNLAKEKSKSVGNAMLLPIPAVSGSMSSANLLNTTSAPHLLEDMQNAEQEHHGLARLTGGTGPSAMPAVQVFEHGIYTIVLASHATDIPAALKRVPAEKRPNLNPKIFQAYEKWYPDWTFALCCFNNRASRKTEPMLWWYLPRDPDHLFFPGLDCHSGDVPNLDANVATDHFIAISSDKVKSLSNAVPVVYRDRNMNGSVKELLPKTIVGKDFCTVLPQGDFVFSIDRGTICTERTLPPGAQPGGVKYRSWF